MEKNYRMLAINPGSTSTKIAVYDNEEPVFTETIRHSSEEMGQFATIYSQYDFRKEAILKALQDKGVEISSLNAIVGRGGNMKPVAGGTYRINEQMVQDLIVGVSGQHASNLAGVIAFEIANQNNIPSFVVDPVVVDELDELARVTGIPEIQRKSKYHALNQRACARQAASDLGGKYNEMNFVVAHLGGGISVGAHRKGRVVDVNNALDGDGAFSPERAGGLPVGSVMDLCYSGEYTKQELRKKIVGNGGLTGYLGTNDGREVQRRIKAGDKYAELIYKAMAYQVSKDIAAAASVLKGQVDAVILTGGIAYDTEFISWVKERVDFISKVIIYPGEFEMEALTKGVLRVVRGEEEARIYE